MLSGSLRCYRTWAVYRGGVERGRAAICFKWDLPQPIRRHVAPLFRQLGRAVSVWTAARGSDSSGGRPLTSWGEVSAPCMRGAMLWTTVVGQCGAGLSDRQVTGLGLGLDLGGWLRGLYWVAG